MNWVAFLLVAGILVAFLLIRRAGQISVKAAHAYLQQGALVIDVRTNAEYQAGHLRDALHIPLNELEPLISRRVRDKNQVLLLHCQSGMRSAAARRKLIQLGYTRSFNLGSYTRAARIVGNH